MATIYQYICNNCDYQAQISGKPDMMMSGPTIPVCCSNCQELSDAIEYYNLDENAASDKVIEKLCEGCNTETIESWDYKKKQCPKCNAGTMKVDKDNGIVMMAD